MSSNSGRARSTSRDAEDDPDLALAIALSLQQDDNVKSSTDGTTFSTAKPSGQVPKSTVAANFGSLALDRRRMEEERIARLKKRSATQAGLDEQAWKPEPKRPELPGSYKPPVTSFGRIETTARESGNVRLPFPKGVFKRTWAFGYPRTGEDIKIEEVLQKDKLQLAVLSSFQWDEEWLFSKVDFRRTKIMLVAYASNDTEKATIRSNAPAESVKFCFPPMHGGYMHSKLQILKYEGYLRIVIPSGNLVPYDWGETGVMENMVFLIDLPRLESSQRVTPMSRTLFGTELRRFLRALGLEEKLVQSLDNYDFSETSRYGFIHTMGRLVKDRLTGTAKLSCRNWECGVLVAVNGKMAGAAEAGTRRGADPDAQAQARPDDEPYAADEEKRQQRWQQQQKVQKADEGEDESAGLNQLFGATIPIPMKLPAGRYTSDESAASRPWFFLKAG
ncbi:Tyrosyl-DNA phosphodiesterase 1 [Colletotrichum chlorophyti]|uniref:Tyrosyl-DNA phosphodiesterase 1 n=1 Tax=Colletotrichum chlorophyti TaxID=708187 RepID=A0A1Q8RBB4_9PEZI|nr:Tyrosyl-DNA phosphodiesterase 1 [Colletotrichum chlorophyti]